MFCTECGRQLPNDVKFCPHCGQNLEGVIDLLKEESIISEKSDLKSEIIEPIAREKFDSESEVIKPLVRETPDSKSDFTVFVEGEPEAIPASSMQALKVVVQNTSSRSILGVELQLSSTTQIRVLTRTKFYRDLKSGEIKSSFFNIRPQSPGVFPLYAALKSKESHSLTFQIEVHITSTKYQKLPKAKLSDKTPRARGSYYRGNAELKEWAPFIVVGIIGLILIIVGGSSLFQGLFGGGIRISLTGIITMIVIGFILISIGTKGRCFCIFFDDCDC
jgi:hypothetical protein